MSHPSRWSLALLLAFGCGDAGFARMGSWADGAVPAMPAVADLDGTRASFRENSAP